MMLPVNLLKRLYRYCRQQKTCGTEKFVLSLMQLLRAERLLFLPMKSYTIRQYLTALKDQANAVMRFLLKSLGFKKEENFAVIGYGSQG